MTGLHSAIQKWSRSLRKGIQPTSPIILAVLVGVGMGVLAIVAGGASSKWASVIVIAAAAPAAALLVNDLKKLILVALVVDLPLGIDIAVQNQGWHQGGPTGYMVSLMTIALIIGYASWIIERTPKLEFFPQVTVPALLYLFTSVLSFIQSPHWQLSMFGFFLKCQVFLMYIYIINHVKTYKDIVLILNILLTCLLMESILMILQYFAGFKLDLGGLVTSATITGGDSSAGVIGARVSGTLGRPGNAALYLNSLLPLALGSYLIGKPVDKRLALGAFSLGVVALIETSSRAGWISFAVAILILLSRVLWTEAGRKALLFVLLGALSVGILFGGQIYERTSTIKNVRSREQLAVMAHNIMEDYPLGIGENTYDLYMSDEYAHPAWVGHRLYPPHNKYLMIQTELGPQGLFAFALLLIAAAWQGRHWMLKANVDPEWAIVGAGFLGGFAAHLIQNQSETFTSRPQVQAFWFVVAMIVVIRRFIDRTEMIAAPVHSGKRKMQLDEPPSHMAGRP